MSIGGASVSGDNAAYDEGSVAVGILTGRIETLKWAQGEIDRIIERWKLTDRFADTRALEEFLALVRDNLRTVQDGSGEAAELVGTVMDEFEAVVPEGGLPPVG